MADRVLNTSLLSLTNLKHVLYMERLEILALIWVEERLKQFSWPKELYFLFQRFCLLSKIKIEIIEVFYLMFPNCLIGT